MSNSGYFSHSIPLYCILNDPVEMCIYFFIYISERKCFSYLFDDQFHPIKNLWQFINMDFQAFLLCTYCDHFLCWFYNVANLYYMELHMKIARPIHYRYEFTCQCDFQHLIKWWFNAYITSWCTKKYIFYGNHCLLNVNIIIYVNNNTCMQIKKY